MNETEEQIRRLTPRRQLEWLIHLAFDLTIQAREEYARTQTEPTAAFAALRCYNELAHQITAQAAALSGEGNDQQDPHDVLMSILHETAEQGGRDEQLAASMQRALERLDK